MSGASLSTNGVPGVRICAKRDCDNVISFPGDFCRQCTAKLRSRGSLRYAPFASSGIPHILGVSTQSSIGNVPSSVAAHLLQRGPILPPPPPPLPSQVRLPNFHPQHYHSSSIAIHPTRQHSIPRVQASITPYTFNVHSEPLDTSGLVVHEETIHNLVASAELRIGVLPEKQGEPPPRKNRLCTRCGAIMPHYYIGDTCPGCHVEVAMLVDRADSTRTEGLGHPFQGAVVTKENTAIDIPKDVMSMFSDLNSNDMGDDVDMEDLELSYPDVAETALYLPPGRGNNHATPSFPTYVVSSAAPLKRQKVSHPTLINPTISPPPLPPTIVNHFTAPEVSKSTRITSRSLKLCSEANCAGIISTDSPAIRCLSCIRRGWMFKKATHSSTPGVRPSIQKNVSILRQGEGKQKSKKKGVTWADQIPQAMPSKEDAGTIRTVGLKDYTILEGLSQTVESGCLETPQPASTANGTEEYISAPIVNESASTLARFRWSSISTQASESDAIENMSGIWVETPISQNSSYEVPGWDSDLPELTGSQAEAESQGESSETEVNEDQPPSAPTGLKIRIPARPAGAYSRKCLSPKCHQLISVGYRWKSCVLCRARSRDYQRRRHDLQGKHLRLDQELLDGENTGTPLAGDLIGRTPKLIELVTGARLCSIRNCTHIIPPIEEYHWKMCAVCRLRRREIRIGARSNHPTKAIDSVIPNSLAKMRKRDPTLGNGRCRSLDCGMLVVDSTSLDCKQCIARMIWLVSRSSVSIPLLERPPVPPPYPQYKCFPALLLHFKNHLSGFLRTQSVFFLFKQPDSAKATFAFDGEFSVVVPDFDIIDRKEEVDANALKVKEEIEHISSIRFSPRRLVSILNGGGISIRFYSMYPVPILQVMKDQDQTSIAKFAKGMQCELEIASLPDYSHRFIPGQRTIIRFRLLG